MEALLNSLRAEHVGLEERINNLEKNHTAEQHEKILLSNLSKS